VQPAGDGIDRWMDVGAGDDIRTVEKCAPGEDQQVREAGIQERIIGRLGVAQLSEERVETLDTPSVETAREPAAGIVLAQGPRRGRRGRPADEPRSKHRPPQLVVR
jgi:hypothetical protein